MKLNIGCGYNKLSGYINIDINLHVKPDFVMPAWNLDFPDEEFIEILASQLIEHLGFFRTKYFLSEANRTLKKEKFIIIETPDIEKSFSNFLEAKNPEDRERVLNWIYGSETKGMNHLYCFPDELLENLLSEFGFEIYKKEFFDYDYLRPCIRYRAFKKKDYEKSKLRKNLALAGVLDFNEELWLSETEKFIKDVELEKINKESVFEACFLSPVIAIAINDLIDKQKQMDKSVLNELKENNFSGWLFELVLKYFEIYRDFDKAYEKVKKDFFDNPKNFIYNFIDSRKKARFEVCFFNKESAYYEFKRRRII
ncbi:MAG: hypothetical protein K6357_02370 [Elusimicrobiota bacterium]